MKDTLIAAALLVFGINFNWAQETDVSLFLKKDKDKYLNRVESKSGNMFHKLGHHGPAIENPWYGLRVYFNKKMAIDVYSKSTPRLELRDARWYPTKEQQRQGWGADYYKVGNSVGLGGIKLWDGEKAIPLNPVTLRTARVENMDGSATMEVISKGVSFKGKNVDVLLKVTVFGNDRMSMVEAIVPNDASVQFITGINYHKGITVRKGNHYIATWGIHPEDVALEKVAVGAALMYKQSDFVDQMNDGKQHLLISKVTDHLRFGLSSCNAKEPDMNSLSKFIDYLEGYK